MAVSFKKRVILLQFTLLMVHNSALLTRTRLSSHAPFPLLIQFRDHHPSFRISEFRWVAEALLGRSKGITFHVPDFQRAGTAAATASAIGPELYSYGGDSSSPVLLWLSGLTANEAMRVCDRCVLVRGLYEVWSHGSTHEAAAAQAFKVCQKAEATADKMDHPLKPLLDAPSESWCVRIRRHGVGKSGLSPKEASRVERDVVLQTYANTLRLIGANRNPVNLSPGGADHKIFVVEDRQAPDVGGCAGGGPLRQVYFGRELRAARGAYKGGVISTHMQHLKSDAPSQPSTEPLTNGRRSAGTWQKGGRTKDGRNHGNKSNGKDGPFYQRVVSQFSIKQRKYIGPTTMDAEMSFLMANAAGVSEGSCVLDPFCGTGGILLACGACGADPEMSFGVDIDTAVLTGKLSARPDEASAFRGERRRLRGLEKQAARAAFLAAAAEGTPEHGKESSSVATLIGGFEVETQAEVELALEQQRRDLQKAGLLPDLSIEGNFRDRGLLPPHLVCADAAALPGALEDYLRENEKEGKTKEIPVPLHFDAIVCDPPYGKREWLGGNGFLDSSDGDEQQTFFKHQQHHSLVTLRERIDGLLSLSSRCLAQNGRLVFFLPVRADFPGSASSPTATDELRELHESNYDNKRSAAEVLELLPSHPDLEVMSIAREPLNHRMHRLLVVMRRRQIR